MLWQKKKKAKPKKKKRNEIKKTTETEEVTHILYHRIAFCFNARIEQWINNETFIRTLFTMFNNEKPAFERGYSFFFLD